MPFQNSGVTLVKALHRLIRQSYNYHCVSPCNIAQYFTLNRPYFIKYRRKSAILNNNNYCVILDTTGIKSEMCYDVLYLDSRRSV